MRKIVLTLGLAGSCFGATWSGMISDSACGVSHAKMMAQHKDLRPVSIPECKFAADSSGRV